LFALSRILFYKLRPDKEEGGVVMADFFDTYDEADGELLDISSLLTAALCVREHQPDLTVISDLLYLMEAKVEVIKGLVKRMNDEYHKLEKAKQQPPSPKAQPLH
jgi:hypothetical protein